MSSMDINPWVLGASYVSIGGLRRILKFADTSKMAPEDVQDIQFSKKLQEIDKEGFSNIPSSMKQIKFLTEISRLDEELNKLQEEKEHNTIFKGTSDLTDYKVLDETVYMLEDLCKHLQDVIDNKDKLIRQLREAHDDHMTVDADLHREMIECFPLMARQLGDLNTRLENIVWTNKFSIEDSNMNSTCRSLASRLADIQTYYQLIDETRALMRTRVKIQRDNSDRTLTC